MLGHKSLDGFPIKVNEIGETIEISKKIHCHYIGVFFCLSINGDVCPLWIGLNLPAEGIEYQDESFVPKGLVLI